MRLIRNAIGMSKLILILLLLSSAIVGAVLSYMWTEGYYQSRRLQLPETATVTITDVAFDPQDPTFFDLTLINSPFSILSVNITQIKVSTEDGGLHDITTVIPSLSVRLLIGESKTLKCIWNWTSYADENVDILVFLADGSGATYQTKTPLIELEEPVVALKDFFLTAWVAAFNNTEPSGNNPTLSVNVGDNVSVTILGKDSVHNIAIYAPGTQTVDMYPGSPSAIVRSADVTPGETASITWTPTAAGTYIYVCEYHVDTMIGDLVVT